MSEFYDIFFDCLFSAPNLDVVKRWNSTNFRYFDWFWSVAFTLESWREKKRKLNQLEKMCTNHHIALCTLQYCFFIDKRDFYEAQVTFFVENSAIKKILGDVDRKFQDSMTIFINIFLQNCIFDSIFLWVIFKIWIFSFNYITG